jgi:hypothetical protein
MKKSHEKSFKTNNAVEVDQSSNHSETPVLYFVIQFLYFEGVAVA